MSTPPSTHSLSPAASPALLPASERPARTRIKICGLRTAADVAAAVRAGADAIGLVFYEKSPRYVTPAEAAGLARLLPPFVTPVGLFVNAPDALVAELLQAIPNLLLQFHGDESPEQCRAHARPYLRAARVTPGFDLVDFASRHADAAALLLDAHVEGYGGGGKVFDWSLIEQQARRGVTVPLVLSGGLHAANVIDGMAALRPYAVDVSSGVESRKGVKDAGLIHHFCQAVRAADAALAAGHCTS